MDQPSPISSTPRAKTVDNPCSAPKEPDLEEAAAWIDHYLLACGIGDRLRRHDLGHRILLDIPDTALSRGLNADGVAELQRRIDRLLLADAGKSGPIADDSYGMGRLLADREDRRIATHDAVGIAVPRMIPAPMPAQVVRDDHSAWNAIPAWPLVSARRLAAGLTGAVALIFGGR